ncbi:uncharacterized protein LOC120750013 [Hirundo rustica]|uniref:uncharacterized protein LOC120750013 n=1 Tax=Hirundo rustica TaxID=43150 RepID=UPI001A951FE0|nr:uncharacterized protein LOC120750013 [Hirundo rustica]
MLALQELGEGRRREERHPAQTQVKFRVCFPKPAFIRTCFDVGLHGAGREEATVREFVPSGVQRSVLPQHPPLAEPRLPLNAPHFNRSSHFGRRFSPQLLQLIRITENMTTYHLEHPHVNNRKTVFGKVQWHLHLRSLKRLFHPAYTHEPATTAAFFLALAAGSLTQHYEVFPGILKPNQEQDMKGNLPAAVTPLVTANMKQENPMQSVSNPQSEITDTVPPL